jgi:hypothetical protein
MHEDILKGALPAFVICFLSIWGVARRSTPPIWFAIPLTIWLAIACYKVYRLYVTGAHKRGSLPWKRESFFFWLSAVVSSLLAPLIWILAVYVMAPT